MLFSSHSSTLLIKRKSISLEQIPCVHFILDISKHVLKSVCQDNVSSSFELLDIIDHKTAKKRCAILEYRLIDDNRCAFGFHALHDALDAALAEVVSVALHCESKVCLSSQSRA